MKSEEETTTQDIDVTEETKPSEVYQVEDMETKVEKKFNQRYKQVVKKATSVARSKHKKRAPVGKNAWRNIKRKQNSKIKHGTGDDIERVGERFGEGKVLPPQIIIENAETGDILQGSLPSIGTITIKQVGRLIAHSDL